MGRKDTRRKEVFCVCNSEAKWNCVQIIYLIHILMKEYGTYVAGLITSK